MHLRGHTTILATRGEGEEPSSSCLITGEPPSAGRNPRATRLAEYTFRPGPKPMGHAEKHICTSFCPLTNAEVSFIIRPLIKITMQIPSLIVTRTISPPAPRGTRLYAGPVEQVARCHRIFKWHACLIAVNVACPDRKEEFERPRADGDMRARVCVCVCVCVCVV